MAEKTYCILIVDDNPMNRDVLSRRLEKQGYQYEMAEDGQQALDLIHDNPARFDLVLLDIMMPQLNGYEVLEKLKSDLALRHIPVIMISAVDDVDSVIRCIELGAEDYLPKPFNPTLLRARIGASLEKKRLRDQEQAYLMQIREEQERSEKLLLNILPKLVAERLKANEGTIAESYSEVTVLFADIVNFTEMAAQIPAVELVGTLNTVFSTFDRLAEMHELEKIKTIGDAYMVVGGLPMPRADHAEAVAMMALNMMEAMASMRTMDDRDLELRIGIHTGPVIAGVIGEKKFLYDLWGDTVNLASRLESHGVPGRIQVSAEMQERLKDKFELAERGAIPVKGKGEIVTYFLLGEA